MLYKRNWSLGMAAVISVFYVSGSCVITPRVWYNYLFVSTQVNLLNEKKKQIVFLGFDEFFFKLYVIT